MRKKIALFLAATMVLGMTACAGGSNSGDETSSASAAESEGTEEKAEAGEADGEIKQVALLTAMAGAESWQTRIQLATTLDEQYGVEITNMDCDGNASKQVEQIESAVEAGYDAIIISPAEVAAIIPAVEKAVAAGVPVVSTEGVFEGASASVNIPEYDSAYFMGKNAAEWLNENWADKSELNVMDLNYEFLDNCIERNNGFMDGLKEHCNAAINVVANVSPTTTVESTNMAESALQADNIDVCMSTNGDFLYGFMLACQNLNVDLETVAGFTMDATPSSLEFMKNGTGIKGICAWSTPQGQVEFWLEATSYVLSDEYHAGDACKEYDLDFLYITQENVDQALKDFGWDK
ncbi:sugar ABC transporter substrate-binding protein [Ruminococcus gauvreauii]|uniref:Sugar ABC transporter substrate-binding protein n=1 Tax=Ruminococcus gauvreauii TaxID=438033 RepID=A0ABY5VBJ3_9FIRM|nr:sugar ABC transporter substrate-binding protein [Ruminococcus gauvreauii]UWP57910.1 sugar ABC transporter substrate-binding protein [Ruminococcus gauvreauii]